MGAKRAVPYITKHPKTGNLIYRRRIPTGLRDHTPRKSSEFIRSLGAESLSAPGATDRLKAAELEYNSIIATARAKAANPADPAFNPLFPELIAYLADSYYASELKRDEDHAWGRPSPPVLYPLRPNHEKDWEESREILDRRNGERLRTYWLEWSLSYAAALGYTINRADPLLDNYLTAIAEASCRLWLALDSRIDAQQGEGTPADTPPAPSRPLAQSRPLESIEASASFKDIAETVLENPRLALGASTKQSTRTALRFFEEACGSPTPEDITRSMVSGWLDLLSQRPARLPQVHTGLSLPDVVSVYAGQDEVKRLSPKTLNSHASTLASIWKKAEALGLIREGLNNPFTRQAVIPATMIAAEEPKGFSTSELEAIFALPVFTQGERPRRGKGEASYWLPLFLLWTGARPEEIAQLIVSDFAAGEDGQLMLTLTNTGAHPYKKKRTLKPFRNKAESRTFPVPQPLIDLGLPRYLAFLKSKGEIALFPKLRTRGARDKLFDDWGRWWSRLLRSENILASAGYQRQPAREFRHTWTTAARAAGIPLEAREYIQVRRVAGGSSDGHYGSGSPLGLHIAKLKDFGADLSGIKPWAAP